jgi:four helix bundle protein
MIEKRRNIDIYERLFDFVVSVIKLLELIPKTSTNLIIINQLTRSVTSMGANAQEADGTSSRKDFIHCFTIVRKEGKETLYWLRLLERTIPKFQNEFIKISEEGNQIVAIVSTIIKKSLAKT